MQPSSNLQTTVQTGEGGGGGGGGGVMGCGNVVGHSGVPPWEVKISLKPTSLIR